MHGIPALVLCCAAAAAAAAESAASPFALCSRLEARIAAGDGIALPDAGRELVRFAGTVDLADGDWPGEFLARAGRTVCVAVSPHTGCYEGATVTSLLMYGVGSSSSRADISNGRVFAVDRNGDTNLLRCGLSTLTRTPLSLQGD